jgi:molybdenum cofactor guanylyltransferase
MIGGVILAGGRSSRMGTDKALVDWHGIPLVQHVYDAVQAAVDGPVVVVKAPGQSLPVPALEDPTRYGGPVVGLKVGLDAVGMRAFVCGVDQPYAHSVIPSLLRAREADVVAYAGEPLGALYQPHVSADGGSLMALLASVDTEWLPNAPPELRSLNRSADLE